MDAPQIIQDYLKFKKLCLDANLFDVDEIIKLFEVWLHQLE